jgi:peptidoglycan/xylan/chitin deacetylase (PgdA/CDA1 family)
MHFLKRYGYNVVKLEQLSALIKEGGTPYKTLAITFDDGYENNYTVAYPILKELDLQATIFITPGLIGNDGYLTWEQVFEMSESGIISIGSHTMSHAYLPDLSEEVLDIEISGSKRAIESHIKKRISSFSYPTGGFNEYIKEKVKKAGYKIAVATNPGRNYPKHDLFAMKRLRISRTSDNLLVFWIEISGFYTWIKEHRDEE